MMNEAIFKGLPYLVQPDNVARYENDKVLILDRRVYPFEKTFVACETYGDVAKAVLDMVTQSGGPLYAVGYGMALAAHQCAGKPAAQQLAFIEEAARVLGTARPTNNNIFYLAVSMLDEAKKSINEGADTKAAMLAFVHQLFVRNYEESRVLGTYAANLLKDGDCVLNHCWAETSIVYTMMVAAQQGKKLTAMCSETRPYLQGARLTADAISDLGIETTVVSDNMPGYAMWQGKINAFFSGADRCTMSGHIINKVGTFQAALCCDYFGIPYYPFSHGPDKGALTDKDVHIEERDPNETLYCLGHRTATENPGISGWYPAFDVVPPHLISAIVTQRGVFSPYDIGSFYKDDAEVS